MSLLYNPYECKRCKIHFDSRDPYMKHIHQHSQQDPYKCPYNCPLRFESEEKLDNHIESTHITENNSKPNVIVCNHCTMMFNSNDDLEAHLNEEHSKKETQNNDKKNKKLYCKVCNISCSRSSQYKHHMQIHTNKYCCDYCNRGFEDNDTLYDHMLSHSTSRPYTCDKCECKFLKEDIFEKHFKECDKNLVFFSKFDNNKKRSNENKYRTFIEDLKKNNKIDGRTSVCVYCGFFFKYNFDLEKHINEYHINN